MVETIELPRKALPEVAGFQAFLRGRIWGFANMVGRATSGEGMTAKLARIAEHATDIGAVVVLVQCWP